MSKLEKREKMQMQIRMVLAALVVLASSVMADPVVSVITISPSDTPLIGELVTFSAVATSPEGLTLTYSWNASDEQQNVTPIAGTTETVTARFSTDGIHEIEVTVTDSAGRISTFSEHIVVLPGPDLTLPDSIDIASEFADEENPDNGLKVKVTLAKGGYLELEVDDSNFFMAPPTGTNALVAPRAFGRILSVGWGESPNPNAKSNTPSPVVPGAAIRSRHVYKNAGLYVATISVMENGSEVGKLRKTLAFSKFDIPPAFEAQSASREVTPPANRSIRATKMTGAFNFTSNPRKNDTVSMTFEVATPMGLTLEQQEVEIGIGNILEQCMIDKKGRRLKADALGSSYSSVKVKFPKLAKGLTEQPEGAKPTKITVKMRSADLDNSGFGTEGISPAERNTTPSARKIQVALMLGGVAFADEATVDFKVAKKFDTGNFRLRAAGL